MQKSLSSNVRKELSFVVSFIENKNKNKNKNKFAFNNAAFILKYAKALINSQHTIGINYLYRIIICTNSYHLTF
jgi:hypothetical protein